MIVRFLDDLLTKPGMAPVFGSPRSCDLPFDSVSFPTSDGLTLKGWLIPGDPHRVIVQTHFGVQGSRSGYTPQGKGLTKAWPEDIPFLRHARLLNDAGYTVLMYDMRSHGESELDPSGRIQGGTVEYRDVLAAVDFVRGHPTYREADIGLLSLCMGCNATAYAYGIDGGLQDVEAIKCIYAVQPLGFADFCRGMGVPQVLVDKANARNQEAGGHDWERTCIDQVRYITVPTLLVQNRNDPFANMDFIQRFHDELGGDKELLWLDLEKKRLAAYAALATPDAGLVAWFDGHMPPAPGPT